MNFLRILLLFSLNELNKGRSYIIIADSCQLRKEEQIMSNGNREFKSDVFSMLMEDKANALSVYNVLNGTNFTNPSTGQLTDVSKKMFLQISLERIEQRW